MTDTPLQLMPEGGEADVWRYVNPLVRMLRGINTGGVILRGDLGTRRDLTNSNTETTGHYTVEAQSLATGGLHAAFPLSTTAVNAAPTAANSAVLITDDGIAVGTGARLDAESIRVYEPGRVDYAEATSLDGELLLGGSGVSAGGLSLNGHLQFLLTTGARIKGDFTNATIANRAAFQTTTANGVTLVPALPLGSGAVGGFAGYNNSAPASATGAAILQANATAVELRADSPAASYLPLDIYTNNTRQARFTALGALEMSAAGQRFLIDGINGTVANRFFFQHFTGNNITIVGALPAGTQTTAAFGAWNASTPTNGSAVLLRADSAEVYIQSTASGAGTVQPLRLKHGTTTRFTADATGIGFYTTNGVAKPTVSGAKGGNAALGSLMTALANLGLVTDSTSA